ncbi:MAG TPA: YciI family protein [Streptosporangiaceae bacterium]
MPRRSRSLLAGWAGDVMVPGGRYAEAKKVLIGLYLLEAADLDAAISWAAHSPAAWHGRVVPRRTM